MARARLEAVGGSLEVIVADNGSTDATAAVASDRGCRVVPVERRRIAAARNGGARAANGDLLAFVDADSAVHPETFVAIREVMDRGGVVGGATGVRLERWSLGIAATFAMLMPLIWLTGIDTGVVFCRRADFEAIGGYDESLPVAEDVKFDLTLKWYGLRRGERLVRLRRYKALGSTRKFDEHGDWHYFRFIALLPTLLIPGLRDRIFHRYWYQPSR